MKVYIDGVKIYNFSMINSSLCDAPLDITWTPSTKYYYTLVINDSSERINDRAKILYLQTNIPSDKIFYGTNVFSYIKPSLGNDVNSHVILILLYKSKEYIKIDNLYDRNTFNVDVFVRICDLKLVDSLRYTITKHDDNTIFRE